MKKIIIIALLLLPTSTHAQVITEIMYDLEGTDANREWIEIYNDSPESVSISTLKLYENDVAHTITAYSDAATEIQPESHVILADDPETFLIDHPAYTGGLYKSVFSLSNTGEALRLIDHNGEELDSVTYGSGLGAKGNGYSLQLFEGVFIEGVPTPGQENVVELVDTSDTSTDQLDTDTTLALSSHASQVTIRPAAQEQTIFIDIGRERMAYLHEPLDFEAALAGSGSGRKVKFIWNMGDGTTHRGRKIDHIYKYSGTYNVVLNAIAGTSRVVARTKVHVLEQKLRLEADTSGIHIYNEGSNEINIGDYILKNGRDEYEFPRDTIIDAHEAIIFDWSKLRLSAQSIVEAGILMTPDKKERFQIKKREA